MQTSTNLWWLWLSPYDTSNDQQRALQQLERDVSNLCFIPSPLMLHLTNFAKLNEPKFSNPLINAKPPD